MKLQDIIDERKQFIEELKTHKALYPAHQICPTIESIEEVLNCLLDVQKALESRITVVTLQAMWPPSEVDKLEKRLSEKFGNKVVCLPPSIKNISHFTPEQFIEHSFDLFEKKQ